MKLFLANSFVDGINGKLYVYEAFHEPPYENDPSIVSLDLKTLEWKIEGKQHLDMQLHHHDSYYNALDDSYTIFGGFGNMRYSNRFYSMNTVVSDSIPNLRWNEITGFSGDKIYPRYFSSLGYSPENNSIYIFGGMGNESGEHIVGRRYFHDFYRVDLNTSKIKKLWELDGEPNMVPAHGMVILGDSAFYVLRYCENISHSHLYLYNFSIKNGYYNVLGDSIPILSDKITTNAHLYYNESRKRFFVTVQESADDISSKFTIYSLLYPPVSLSTYEKAKSCDDVSYTLIVGSLVVISILSYIGLEWDKKKKKKILKDHNDNNTKSEHLNSAVIKKIADKEYCGNNAVYIFGDFTVFDKKGRDISYMFSMQLRQCFFLILYYSCSEGISSNELSDRLWPDKPKDKVKNSRGVALNHLRTLLNELEGITLVYEKGFFKFILNETFYCDYLRCMKIISDKLDDSSRKEFINIIGRGKFVAFLDNPLFDYFKENVECRLEVIILERMRESFKDNDFLMTISFAKAEFNIDPINEEALNCCIKSYFHLKRENQAIVAYQHFMAEYLKGTGEEYPRPFSDFWC